MKRLCLFLFLNIFSFSIFSQNIIPSKDAFHFSQYNLENDSEISAAKLNSTITEKDRIIVSKDGHLEANGKRIRIFGTNLSSFPANHDEAFFYAQCLANQGYNCIRFHHTDASWSNCFLKKEPSGKWVIDKQRLDAFDFFFYLLKENGIYSNINLLTGRSMSSADGFPKEFDKIPWKSQHCYGFWNENARNYQKKYAFDLLKHVNPYTGLSYAEDPAVAIVEVNNENGFLMAYLTGWIDDYNGNLFQEIEDQWNQWLKTQKLDYSKLSTTYNKSSNANEPLVTEASKWNLEQHNGAKATVSSENNNHTIKIEKNGGESWHIQYGTSKLNVSSEEIYTLKFSAKASAKCEINVSINQAHDPWKAGGFSEKLELTTKWQDYEFKISNLLTDSNLRLIFTQLGFLQGKTISIKNISFVNGGKIEYVSKGSKSSKTNATVKFPKYSEFKNYPKEYQNLILSFLWEKENDYWQDMNNYLKKDIGIKALTMGTAMGCSTTYLQNSFDIIDSHAYWNHPSFPVNDWDSSTYYVKNKDLTKSISDNTLSGLAKYRVYGKPFSVSEYDHPYPNQYTSQMYPMIAAFASFQDWDCIFTFCSEIPANEGTNCKINGYFDQSNNPSKACAAPIASRIFRNFLVSPGNKKVYVPLSLEKEKSNLYKNHGWSIGNSEIYGIKPSVAFKHQLGIALDNKIPQNGLLYSQIEAPEKTITDFNDTKELYWDTESGVFIVCNKDVTISVINSNSKIPEYPAEWMKEGTILPLSNTDDFASFMAVKDENKYLIFVCSWVGNSSEALREFGTKASAQKNNVIIREEKNLTTEKHNGKSPVYALGINGTFSIFGHKNYNLFEANMTGNRTEKSTKGKMFNLKRNTKTLWYIVE